MAQDGDFPRLLLWGCGKMGSAMLNGWLKAGWPVQRIEVIDPFPSDKLLALGVGVNPDVPQTPDFVVVAVKPQMMEKVLPKLVPFDPRAAILSIAAGTRVAQFAQNRPENAPIIRAMPNTPSEIGKGITGFFANDATSEAQKRTAHRLLSALGQSLELEKEEDIDAVTGVSGSGPAYVFYFIEALSAAARAQGLSADIARQLAIATVEGAGALARQSQEDVEQLRINVTSPAGTTAAGLAVLMDPQNGLSPVVERTVEAAVARSKALGKRQ